MESRCLLSSDLANYSGVVFNDANGDGIRKDTDWGAAGVLVKAYGVASVKVPVPLYPLIDQLVPVQLSAITNSQGVFTFPKLVNVKSPIAPFAQVQGVPVVYSKFELTVPSGFRATTSASIPAAADSAQFGIVRIPRITGFYTVNVGLGGGVNRLSNAINLVQLPQANIFMTTSAGQLGSVRFNLDNIYSRVEQGAPWSVFGDLSGKFNPGKLKLGQHTLTATLYSRTDGTGVVLGQGTIQFSVVSSSPQFDYSLPDRYGKKADSNGNQLIDMPNSPEYVNPGSYTLNLDASKSTGNLPITSYSWVIKNGPLGTSVIRATGKNVSVNVPDLGTYRVYLTTTLSDGYVATQTNYVQVRDVLIVQLGDSYGSGEGNPQTPSSNSSQVKWADGATSSMTEENRQAHRSVDAASSQMAIMLEDSDPHFSVTYVNLAQTGAMIANLIGDTHYGVYLVKDAATGKMVKYPLPNQLEQMKSIVKGRTVDYLSLSIGGNDAGFTDRIIDMVSHIPAGQSFNLKVTESRDNQESNYKLSVPIDVMTSMKDLKKKFASQIDLLPSLYEKLDKKIDGLAIPITHTLVTEYPDPTHNEKGQFATMATDFASGFYLQASTTIEVPPKPPPPVFPPPFPPPPPPPPDKVTITASTTLPLEIDSNEAQVLHDNFMIPLNKKMQEAAGKFGWKYISGIADDFNKHGYAASGNQGYFVTETQSRIRQGIDDKPMKESMHYDVGFDILGIRINLLTIDGIAEADISKGGMHPNAAGHNAIAKRIYSYVGGNVA